MAKNNQQSITQAKARQRTSMRERCELFIQHYLVHLKVGEAAVAAGYTKKTADKAGYRMLDRPEIREAIRTAMAKRAEKAQIDADWVLIRLIEMYERCSQAKPVLDKAGKETGVYRFDSKGALRALELIGKHINMFTDNRLGQSENAQANQPQLHLHAHLGADGQPIASPPGPNTSSANCGFLPPIMEVIVNRAATASKEASAAPMDQAHEETVTHEEYTESEADTAHDDTPSPPAPLPDSHAHTESHPHGGV